MKKLVFMLMLLWSAISTTNAAYVSKSVMAYGNVTYVTGKFGNAIHTDGVSGTYATVEGVTIPANKQFAVSFWLRTTTTSSSAIPFVIGGTNTYFAVASGKLRVSYGSSGNLTSTVTVNDNVWHHIEADFGASETKVFVDGVTAITSATTYNAANGVDPGSSIVAIGGLSSGLSNLFAGDMDDISFWNAPLHNADFTPPTVVTNTSDPNLATNIPLDAAPTESIVVTTIPASSTAIYYSPYNWNQNAGNNTSVTIQSGAYLKTIVTATSIVSVFDTQYLLAPYPQIIVRVDGFEQAFEINPTSTTYAVGIPASTSANVRHFVELFVKSTTSNQRRWTSFSTGIRFKGFNLAGSSSTAQLAEVKPYRLLLFGDSITEGFNTLSATATNDPDRSSSLAGYGLMLRNHFNAEVGIVAFSSTGITKGGTGGVPSAVQSYSLVYANVPRSFTANPPDAVLINEGTNDASDYVTSGSGDAVTFTNALLNAIPNGSPILFLRPFNQSHSELVTLPQYTINPSRIIIIQTAALMVGVPNFTDGLHPSLVANTVLAPRIATAITLYFPNPVRRGYRNMTGY